MNENELHDEHAELQKSSLSNGQALHTKALEHAYPGRSRQHKPKKITVLLISCGVWTQLEKQEVQAEYSTKHNAPREEFVCYNSWSPAAIARNSRQNRCQLRTFWGSTGHLTMLLKSASKTCNLPPCSWWLSVCKPPCT